MQSRTHLAKAPVELISLQQRVLNASQTWNSVLVAHSPLHVAGHRAYNSLEMNHLGCIGKSGHNLCTFWQFVSREKEVFP